MRFKLFVLMATILTTSTKAADLGNLTWLQGCWAGAGLGGEVSECWLKSQDNIYTGVFQLESDGKQRFNEIVMLAEFDGKIEMRVKHFSPNFIQWKSDQGKHITFTLQRMDEQSLEFDGLTYELRDNLLHIALDISHKDGHTHTERFVLSRQ